MPKVINRRDWMRRDYQKDIFVGRPSMWGNPFVIGRDGTREEVIAKYREYLLNSNLMQSISDLRGKNLVCFCAPLPCHADVLLELANV